MRLIPASFVLLTFLGCNQAPQDGAIQLTVFYDSPAPACVRVTLRDAEKSENTVDTKVIPPDDDKARLRIAVYRPSGWGENFVLAATGHADPECSGEAITTAQSNVLRYTPGKVTTYSFKLEPPDKSQSPAPTGLAQGAACAANDQCASGFCSDSVCCNTACSGACDSCNGTTMPGTCTLVAANQDGAPSCGPYTCGGESTICRTNCNTAAECLTGFRCDNGECKQ